MPLKHIAICGDIGSGKTTLTEKLSKHYGWTPLYESAETNPYLRDFYQDMPRWSFHLQIFFLNSRFQQIKEILLSTKTIIQDRTIYEDGNIFAANLYNSGYMNDRDYQNYLGTFTSMISFVKPPDLLIYLKADIPKLIGQIEKRARDYEHGIHLDYLKNLNDHYEEWILRYNLGKVLIIDVNNLDYMDRAEDFSFIVKQIEQELQQLKA